MAKQKFRANDFVLVPQSADPSRAAGKYTPGVVERVEPGLVIVSTGQHRHYCNPDVVRPASTAVAKMIAEDFESQA